MLAAPKMIFNCIQKNNDINKNTMDTLQQYYEQNFGDTYKIRPFSVLSIEEKEALKKTIGFRAFDFQQKLQITAGEAANAARRLNHIFARMKPKI